MVDAYALSLTSCFLSMIGAILVGCTWGFPAENRVKHGRILLLWLSVCDFMSSFVYFLGIFNRNDGNEKLCQATALLGIFFPVASFIWTDFVALYLFLIVSYRSKVPVPWSDLLRYFHAVAWGVPAVIIIFVGAFGHAGVPTDDDGKSSNTGGWCWITADGRDDIFYWEIIGGKGVEWLSCVVLLPFLYISVGYKLNKLDQAIHVDSVYYDTSEPNSNSAQKPVFSLTAEQRSAVTGGGDETAAIENPIWNTGSADVSTADGAIMRTISPSPAAAAALPTAAAAAAAVLPSSKIQFQMGSDSIQSTDTAVRSSTVFGSNISSSAPVTTTTITATGNAAASGISRSSVTLPSLQKKIPKKLPANKFFNKFYVKLAALPVVFFFIRLWGSLRIILTVTRSAAANDTFLEVLQAFFDPSQGFFNAILFVFSSKEDRGRFLVMLAMVMSYLPFCESASVSLSTYAANNYGSSSGASRQKRSQSLRQFVSSTKIESARETTSSVRHTEGSFNMGVSDLSDTFIENLEGGGGGGPDLGGLDRSSNYGSIYEDADEDGDYGGRLSNFSFDDGSVIVDPRDFQ